MQREVIDLTDNHNDESVPNATIVEGVDETSNASSVELFETKRQELLCDKWKEIDEKDCVQQVENIYALKGVVWVAHDKVDHVESRAGMSKMGVDIVKCIIPTCIDHRETLFA
ncbi:hypothetical protein O0I10_013071 [Lichtheimia ornata]|uniref:Uncharacterized protein n=1 Tax=Lichtheimia ornata TaxID=688661 RepID=A0AAD7UQ82_9FUNG|nr:uncharacterized protein O0I10_013071 [Lichtheimia ornata]KAJ8651393.1 hypothetical protein O0I10_013071 [Lichtheimia ornata]